MIIDHNNRTDYINLLSFLSYTFAHANAQTIIKPHIINHC